jgi:PAS domain S-box-containing protein
MQNLESTTNSSFAETGAHVQENAEKFFELFYAASVAYFVLDSNCTVTEVNQSGCSMLRLNQAELLHSNFKRFVAQNSLAGFSDFMIKVFDTNCMHVAELALLIPESPDIVVHAQGKVSGDKAYCLLTLVDITKKKQTEEGLQTMAIRYRRLFESAKDGLLIMDADSCQIVDVNPFLLAMLGSSSDELIGQKLWDFEVFKNNSLIKDAFLELQVNGYVRLDDIALETREGKRIDVEIVSNVFMVENKKMIQCDIRDITERKKNELYLKETVARLREVNNNKDKFFSIISHDLRRPFSCIIGYSNLLAEYVQEKQYDKIEEYANVIQNSSWRAMDLLLNLVEWSQSQMGRIAFNPANIDLHSFIREGVELSKDFARQKSITVSWELPGTITLFADRSMLNVVFRNLISNAIKFTQPGGKVSISAQLRSEDILISVTDNGVGIDNSVINKLFRSEERHSTIGTQKEMGSGLGLLLCKEFIEKHGGKIWVESMLGVGSTFFFTIPRM